MYHNNRGKVYFFTLALGLRQVFIFIRHHFNGCSRLVFNVLVSIISKCAIKVLDVGPINIFNSDAMIIRSIG